MVLNDKYTHMLSHRAISTEGAIIDPPVMNSQIKSASTGHRWWWNRINPYLESGSVRVLAQMSTVALRGKDEH